MRINCPECSFERQVDAVPGIAQIRVRCGGCGHRFLVEPGTASVIGRVRREEASATAAGAASPPGPPPRPAVEPSAPRPTAPPRAAPPPPAAAPRAAAPRAARAPSFAPPRSPEQANDLRVKGEKALFKQQLDSARAAFEACLAFDETHPHDHYQLGRVLVKMVAAGEESVTHEDARKHFRRAVELFPDRPDYHMALGDLMKREGNAGAAIKHFRAALAVEPGHHGAMREIRLHRMREASSARSPTERLKAMFQTARGKKDDPKAAGRKPRKSKAQRS